MSRPVVSVICLSYNHKRFIREAIDSVIAQTYANIEVILIDDASTDGTQEIIRHYQRQHPEFKVFLLEKNLGNCAAFNFALKNATGEFIIDFATDDVMLSDRIERQVEQFAKFDKTYGVVFSDALYIDEAGKEKYKHFERLFKNRLLQTIPEGDIYHEVLSTYFIPSPTMMVRKDVFDSIGGYDEQLSYEDFDFWVRSSRKFKYAFLDAITTKIRVSSRSMSQGWYRQGDKQLRSTYEVCRKALSFSKRTEDFDALARRLKFEIRQSVFSGNNNEAKLFYKLLREIGHNNILYKMIMVLNVFHLPLSPVRNLYHRLRYGSR
jgi:glycosyltransferase involved in cell wall biosynthesis